MKFQGLRKRPAMGGEELKPTLFPKCPAQPRYSVNLTHCAQEQKQQNVSSNSCRFLQAAKPLPPAPAGSSTPSDWSCLRSLAYPLLVSPLFQDFRSLQETWPYFYCPLQGALISRCLTDLEPQVFYPTLPHPLISISLDVSLSRYPPRSRVMPNKWTFFWDLDSFWRLFGHPAHD